MAIGAIVRLEAAGNLEGTIVAGSDVTSVAFDLDSERGKDFGINLGVDKSRCYENYQKIFAQEADKEDGVEFVSIATPNGIHYGVAKVVIEAGLHVMCEKPLFLHRQKARRSSDLLRKKQNH